MKKLLCVFLSVFISLSYLVPVTADEEISVYIDGQKIDFDQPPVMVNDRVLVPMRAITEALGATVEWDESLQCASAMKPGVFVAFIIDSPTMYRNLVNIPIDVPAQLINDRTMLPLRALAEPFGLIVEWEETTQCVIMTSTNTIQTIQTDSYTYIGETQYGISHGYGILYKNGENSPFLMGLFVESEFKQGIRYYPDGSTAQGYFSNWELSGEGEFFSSNGTTYQGSWNNGLIINNGYAYYSDGTSYYGPFDENLRPNGNGILYLPNSYLKLEYKNGVAQRYAAQYDYNDNYIQTLEIVDGKTYTYGTAPKLSTRERDEFDRELNQLQEERRKIDQAYLEALEELNDYIINGNPFETEWAETIYTYYGVTAEEVMNGAPMSNDDGIDKYAAANAARQRETQINAARQAVLDMDLIKIEQWRQNIEDSYKQQIANNEMQMELLKQKYNIEY